MDDPKIQESNQTTQNAQKSNQEPRKPMTPIEIMMATQMAMRDTFRSAKTLRNQAHGKSLFFELLVEKFLQSETFFDKTPTPTVFLSENLGFITKNV